jgi:hypothetical protein
VEVPVELLNQMYQAGNSVGARHRSFLEGPFHGQKAAPKLLNNALYAIFRSQIKKLPWSDNHLAGSFERP